MRPPAERAQKRIRGALQSLAACTADVPELDTELRAAIEAVTQLEHATAELLGKAPSAAQRREQSTTAA